MREKLIELLEQAKNEAHGVLGSMNDGFGAWYADYLLACGVIVLPCKVGDTVWVKGHRFPAEVECINITENGLSFEYAEYERSPELTELWDDGTFEIEDIGKTVFLTREEAEAALKSKVDLADVVDIDKQNKDNNAAMRKVIDFVTEGLE